MLLEVLQLRGQFLYNVFAVDGKHTVTDGDVVHWPDSTSQTAEEKMDMIPLVARQDS